MRKKDQAYRYMEFHFLKLSESYRRLMRNEKVVARQEFLSTYDTYQSRLPLAAYALTGLYAGCDVLLWRLAMRPEHLNQMSCRLQESGLGKYLIPTRSYLGTVQASRYVPAKDPDTGDPLLSRVLGKAPYLIVEHMSGLAKEKRPEPTPALHVADTDGMGDPGCVLALESEDPAGLQKLASDKDWRDAAFGPAHICIHRDIRDLVDSLG